MVYQKIPCQSSYSFELFKFHDLFHELAQFSMALGLVVTFETFQNYFYFGGIFLTTLS